MDAIISGCRTLGFCWCFTKPQMKGRCFIDELHVSLRPPIFWVMGPSVSGKMSIGKMLAGATGYLFLHVSDLINEELKSGNNMVLEEFTSLGLQIPDETVVSLLKDYIRANYLKVKGFIICGFPITLEQAKLFDLLIIKANIIIYCSIDSEMYLERMRGKHGNDNVSKVLRKYIDEHKKCQATYRFYEHKTLKVFTRNPVNENFSKLVKDLDFYWGYKF